MSASQPIDMTLVLPTLHPPEADFAQPAESVDEEGGQGSPVCASRGTLHGPYRFRERHIQHITLLAGQGWQVRLEVETLGWQGWPTLRYADGFVGLVGWGRSIEIGLLRATHPGEADGVSPF